VGNEENGSPDELNEVLEREGAYWDRPVDLYSRPPFSKIARIMEEEGLSTTDVRVFLKWKTKNEFVTKAIAAKAKKRKKAKKVDPTAKLWSFSSRSGRANQWQNFDRSVWRASKTSL